MALEYLEKTKELYKRAEIAGSLRRKERIVHDIDIAVIPSDEELRRWIQKLKSKVAEIGGRVISTSDTICDLEFKGAQVNLFLCPNEDAWGVALMWATGPKGHTIGLTLKARGKGLLYNSKGIWTREDNPKLIPAPTELDVARILGWEYKPPEQRGRSSRKKEQEERA